MPITALLFGSIGAVAETSDIQRRAYNSALKELGIDWEWTPETYRKLLKQSGGKERLAQLAAATGKPLDDETIDRIHARKTEIACKELVDQGIDLRPGVSALMSEAKRRGMKLGFVTSTYAPNIDAIFEAGGDDFSRSAFAVVIDRSQLDEGKPAPDAYIKALGKLGLTPDDAIAIEDTAASVMSAKRAGIMTIATPGALSDDQDFWQADLVVDALADNAGTIEPRVMALLDRS